MFDPLIEAIQRTISEYLNELNTVMPGKVVSYNASTNRAVVRPSLPKRLADGTDLPAPQIVSCPVKWPAAGGGYLTFPLAAGDPVELRFSQRSLDNWLSGSAAGTNDPRSFDLTDCICDPGLAPVGIPGSTEGAVFALGNARVVIGTDGSITLSNGAGSLTLGADGIVRASQDVMAQTVSLHNHVHTGVVAGGSLSGVPQA